MEINPDNIKKEYRRIAFSDSQEKELDSLYAKSYLRSWFPMVNVLEWILDESTGIYVIK